MDLKSRGLVLETFGNVSGLDRSLGVMAIKPSGIAYQDVTADDIVVLDLDGRVVEGRLRPSSDTATHLELYRSWIKIQGITHTHSTYATAWAQACTQIPCLGTTHADVFYGPIPVTESLTSEEIRDEYERNTGKVIVRRFQAIDPLQMPAVLVANHGPFCWGDSPGASVVVAHQLEEVARSSLLTRQIQPTVPSIGESLLRRHFFRKHGKGAYYGQNRDQSS